MVEKVFSIGGSIVHDNLDRLEELAVALERDEQVLVVTGAGELSRYQDALEDVTNKGERDLVGIKATRLHARALSAAMDAYPGIPETADQILEAASTGQNIVMGGLTPGYSTDAVAATAAELLEAELYIATTVDGVYTRHPDEEGAEKLDEVSASRLLDIVSGDNEPGSYELVDETAVKIIERSNISTRVLEGTVENLRKPEDAPGTDIVSRD
ncbi:MAG: UMP kinase [Candidatus Nanohaloarchaea archaeon]